MKYLLILLLTLSTSVFAGVIPATLYGENLNSDELWTFTDTSGNLDDASFFLNAQFGGFNTFDRDFGLYQYDINNNSIINTLTIFDTATINSGIGAGNVILDQVAQTVSTSYGSIDTSLAQGLGFGFYFTSDGFTSYSQSSFNTGGVDFFGFYHESDPFSVFNEHVYAMDNDSGNNLDWVAMSISDIRTGGLNLVTVDVPEPTTIAIFGLALVGMALRRKSN